MESSPDKNDSSQPLTSQQQPNDQSYQKCAFHIPFAALRKHKNNLTVNETSMGLDEENEMLDEASTRDKQDTSSGGNETDASRDENSRANLLSDASVEQIQQKTHLFDKAINLFEDITKSKFNRNSTMKFNEPNTPVAISKQPEADDQCEDLRVEIKPDFSIVTVPIFIQKTGTNSPNLDTLLGLIGSFGIYQKFEFFLIGFLAILPSMVAYSYVFVSATPTFTCKTVLEVNKIKLNIHPFNHNNSTIHNYFVNVKSIENLIESRRLISILSDETISEHQKGNSTLIKFDNKCSIDHEYIEKMYGKLVKKKRSKKLSIHGQVSLAPSAKPWWMQNYGYFYDEDGNRIMTNLTTDLHSSKLTCVEWYFDTSMYGRTVVSDWNLVCLRSHLKAATQNTFIMGTGMSVFTGILSDRLGRRTAMIILIFTMFFVLNLTQLLMHSEALSINTKLILFTISRFFQGVCCSMFTISFVLLMEITGPKHRVTAGNINAYSFSIGQMIIAGLAFYFKDWRKVQWVLAFYILPFFIYYWLVPESPRWLLSVGRIDEARRVLLKITRINQAFSMHWCRLTRSLSSRQKAKSLVELESSVSKAYMFDLLQDESIKLENLKKSNNYTSTIRGIFGSPMLIRRCLIIFYTWMILLAVYLGIGMGISGNLHKFMNPYAVFLIAACCEFVSIVTVHLVLNRFGRKFPMIIFMFICSIAIYLIPVYYKELPKVSMFFYFLAKYAIGAAQATFLIYTSELFPTPMRSTGVGMSVAIARIGGVWAPQLNVLEASIGTFNTPFMIFSFLCLFSSFLCLFLPETLNKPLPETTLQATLLNRRTSTKI